MLERGREEPQAQDGEEENTEKMEASQKLVEGQVDHHKTLNFRQSDMGKGLYLAHFVPFA